MKTISKHRKSGRHSKGSRDMRITNSHYEALQSQVERLNLRMGLTQLK